MKTNIFQTAVARSYLMATTVSALLSLTTHIGIATAQSADPKHPTPLQPGDNIGVISNQVQNSQYYYATLGPGKGTLTIEFSANGFPGTGGQIRVILRGSKVTKNYSVVVKSTQALFNSDTARPGQVTIPFDVKQAQQVILRIDPPSSGLLVAAGRYNIQATGAVKSAPIDSNPAQVVGTYRVHGYIFGNNQNGTLIKLLPNGKILSETESTGSWTLFDPGSKTYVLQLADKRSTLIFWPAVGFSVESTGNPDLQLVR